MPQQPGWGQQPGGMPPQQPGWGQQPGGMPPQQPGWGQQPGGMPPQQPGWGPQPGWAPPAPKSQSSSSKPFLVMLLIVLLIGLGALTYFKTPIGATIKDLFQSATGGTGSGLDITKPVISNVNATAGQTSATITWATNELSSSQVEYGTNKEQTSLSALRDDPTIGETGFVVTHTVPLTGLTPSSPAGNITYYYRVKSKDAAGNEAVSDWKTFETALSDT